LPLFRVWHRSCSKNLLEAGVVTMREKPEFRARTYGSPEADPERVQSDLENRGVDPEFSRPVARRLAAIAPDLSTPEYAAILANELQRLMEGFTGELRKLDEGLQMLSTYILRMGALSSREGSGNLH